MINEIFEMRNEDCKVAITLRIGKEYEGLKLPVIEESDARDEPTLEEDARNEKKIEK